MNKLKKGPNTNTLTQEQKDALRKRLDELTKPKFNTLEEALAHAKKEIKDNR